MAWTARSHQGNPALLQQKGNWEALSRAMSRFSLKANSLTWDHHPHPPLRSCISAQAGTVSPPLSQAVAPQPGLCPRLLAGPHVSCRSFPPGLHQLPSSAAPDQTTGWTLGLADSFILWPAECSDPVGPCQGRESTAGAILDGQPAPPCRAALLAVLPDTPQLHRTCNAWQKARTSSLSLGKDPAITVR